MIILVDLAKVHNSSPLVLVHDACSAAVPCSSAGSLVMLFYHGDIEFFSISHLKYAVPAIFCLALISVPPSVLLWYPLGWRLLSICGLSESKWLNQASRFIPLAKLKPLLDTFQSCFKDNFRFFAGLYRYFVYRMLTLVAYAACTGHLQFYTTVQVLLVLMLILHAVTQPYQKMAQCG